MTQVSYFSLVTLWSIVELPIKKMLIFHRHVNVYWNPYAPLCADIFTYKTVFFVGQMLGLIFQHHAVMAMY